LAHDFETADLSVDHAADQFDAGPAALSKFRDDVAAHRESLPTAEEQEARLADLLDQLDRYQQLLTSVTDALYDAEEVAQAVDRKASHEDMAAVLTEWATRLNALPAADNPFGLLDVARFDISAIEFALLDDGQTIRDHLVALNDAQAEIERIEDVRQEYGIPSERLADRRDELDRLLESLQDPDPQPDGLDAVLYADGAHARVGVPATEAPRLAETPAFTDIAQTPRVFATSSDEDDVAAVADLRSRLQTERDDLDSALAALADIRESLETITDQLPSTIETERDDLQATIDTLEKQIETARDEWVTAHATLCSEFDIEQASLSFDSPMEVQASAETLEWVRERSVTEIKENLREECADFAGVSVPATIDADTLEQFAADLEAQTDVFGAARAAAREIERWLDDQLDDITDLHNKLATIEVVHPLGATGAAVLDAVEQRSDISALVDELAADIQANVEVIYHYIFGTDELRFQYRGDGEFTCTLNGDPITHPSGSQRAVISFGIMLSLASSFDLPLLLDEAGDRFDYDRLAQFLTFVTDVTAAENLQTCLVLCRSKNIEAHEPVREQVAKGSIYRLQRHSAVENEIASTSIDSIL